LLASRIDHIGDLLLVQQMRVVAVQNIGGKRSSASSKLAAGLCVDKTRAPLVSNASARSRAITHCFWTIKIERRQMGYCSGGQRPSSYPQTTRQPHNRFTNKVPALAEPRFEEAQPAGAQVSKWRLSARW
jgi:hypothetical protein